MTHFRQNVWQGRYEHVSTSNAFLHQTPQRLSALQSGPTVHNYDSELPLFFKSVAQNVVDKWRAGKTQESHFWNTSEWIQTITELHKLTEKSYQP